MPRCLSFLFPLFSQRSSAMTPLGHRWPCWSASATAPRRSCARRAARCRRKTHSGRSCRMTRNRSCDACRRNCGRWGWGWGDGDGDVVWLIWRTQSLQRHRSSAKALPNVGAAACWSSWAQEVDLKLYQRQPSMMYIEVVRYQWPWQNTPEQWY